jgi:hypothetical protein
VSNRRKIRPQRERDQSFGLVFTIRRALKHPTSSKMMRDPKFRSFLKGKGI